MIKKTILTLGILLLASSCVSKKVYNELEIQLENLQKDHATLTDENANLQNTKTALEFEKEKLTTELNDTKTELEKLNAEYVAAQNKHKLLQDAYTALEKNSGEALQTNLKKNQALLAELDTKSKALAIEKERLSKNAQRLQELENLIAAKETAMKKLKETLTKALNNLDRKSVV